MEQELQWIVQNLRAIIADFNDECSVGTGITLDTVEGYKHRQLQTRAYPAVFSPGFSYLVVPPTLLNK